MTNERRVMHRGVSNDDDGIDLLGQEESVLLHFHHRRALR